MEKMWAWYIYLNNNKKIGGETGKTINQHLDESRNMKTDETEGNKTRISEKKACYKNNFNQVLKAFISL